MTYEQLEARVVEWMRTQPAIRAVIAVGSRARPEYPADRWSDLDIMILTTDRDRYASDPSWLENFGEVWLTYLDEAAPGDPEWFAVYAGGVKLDAVLLRVEESDARLDLDALLKQFNYQDVFRHGVRVLFDREGEPRLIPPKPFAPPPPPTAAEFDHVVSGFLLTCITTAKFIARGDLWRAQTWFANDLRPNLLRLTEMHEYGRDTWYAGRFLDVWADKRALNGLAQTFAPHDPDALRRALTASLDLFRWLGQETAEKFGFTYPAATHDKIASLVREVFGG